jgi:hypothetical protein
VVDASAEVLVVAARIVGCGPAGESLPPPGLLEPAIV